MKHIFFDLDRTLWDFDTNSKNTLTELHAIFQLEELYGIPCTRFISKYLRINKSFWAMYQSGRVDAAYLREARFYHTLQAFGIENNSLAQQLCAYYMRECPRKTAVMEGTTDVLEALAAKYPLHIITNGFTDTQKIKLESARLAHYFGHVVTSDMAQAQKPSQVIFSKAWELAGKPEKDQCYYVGDDWNADVRGSRQFGFTPIWYSTEERRTKILQARSLKRVLELLV